MGEKNAVEPSVLYLVATPIGNLGDMTPRALKVLAGVDLVAAEDTRNTLKLLTHFGIKPSRLVSCFEHNEVRRVEEILKILGEGGSVALATDAGMPGISDPGSLVVKAVAEAGFRVSALPGASALLAALAASGFPGAPFVFVGFMPPKSGERQKVLRQWKNQECPLVFFESPHRMRAALKDMMNVFGNRKAVVGRELTKLHEEYLRGNLQELWKHFKAVEPRGEFVVVVEGGEWTDRSPQEKWMGVSLADQLAQLMREGRTKTEAVKEVCRLREMPREVVYKIAMELKVQGKGNNDEGDERDR